jgi:hypothetical protein
MRFGILFLLVAVVLISCTAQQISVNSAQQTVESADQRFKLMMQFGSEEALKRMLVRFQNLKMELDRPISASDLSYSVFVTCKDFEIDGIVTKLNLEEGIVWAKRAE